MKDFQQFLEHFQRDLNQFNKIEDHIGLEKFHSFLSSQIQVAEIAYPNDLNNLLMTANQFPLVIDQIQDKIKPLTEKFEVEITPRGIFLRKDKVEKIFPLMDIKDFIQSYIYKNEDYVYYLILAWILESNRFFSLQVFSVFMQIQEANVE